MSPTAPDHPSPRPKATLFCPACGRPGHAGDGWRERTGAGGPVLVCPDCGDAVARRDTRSGVSRPSHPDGRAGPRLLGATSRLAVDATVGLGTALARCWLRPVRVAAGTDSRDGEAE